MCEFSTFLTVTRTLLLAATTWAALLPSELLSAQRQIGLPGCPTSCGDVSVPYPFGIAPGCSLAGFYLTCDTTHTPPRLLLGNGTLQVTGISLDNSTVRVLGPGIGFPSVLRLPTGGWTTVDSWGGLQWGLSDDDSGPYIVSEAHNEFILRGCYVFAELRLADGPQPLITSCGAVCDPDGEQVDECELHASGSHCKRCYGIGCCQMPVPIGSMAYVVRLTSILGWDEPFAALIAEEGWFEPNITAEALSNAERTAIVPIVLAWAIVNSSSQPGPNETRDGRATCPNDLGSTGCHSRYSSCTSTHRASTVGYTCGCWDGYQGNPYLPDGCQGLSIGLGVGSGAALLFLVLASTFVFRKIKSQRKKRLRQRFFKQNRGQLLQQLVSQRADIAERMIITLKELEKATNNFDKARELGDGGHGVVYKGILSSLHVVAIKKSKIVVQREINAFINEVAILSQINHRNIVKLIGCCLETEVPLLVYEFITNGTLYHHLHVEAQVSLSWKDRLRIAVETARALAYLHSFASLPIIHRDIKSPNILLNDNLTVKLSDFGASRHIPVDQTGVDTVVHGTFGYLDPTYYSTGHLTEKSDVYSFGVILIELITRKKPVSYRSAQGYSLVNHFITILPGANLDHILDPQVIREGGGEVVDIALLAAMCIKSVSEERPTMRQVEMTLESIYAAKEFDSSEVADEEFEENCTWDNSLSVGGTNTVDMKTVVNIEAPAPS
ncbi:Wall-associated receptor kinase 2 [Dichanthelium oligosanthes]|uniref:Wall-associated receptor kinase 2 n=1 Tax=Dichanthelium oligosanthes TaxID=888268 RepID=A0A1E5UUC9_9POAL|nr:Wall-associated receptor kinase 2 [Dichanthelium oligosanthes]